MSEKKSPKDKIVKLIQDAAKDEGEDSKEDETEGNRQEGGGSHNGHSIVVNADGSATVQVAARDIVHNHINSRPRIVNQFTPGENHITPEQAATIKDLIRKIVEIELAADKDKSSKSVYAKWHRKIWKEFKVNSYLAIPREDGDKAIAWLKKQKAVKRPQQKKGDKTSWRNDTYTGIYARLRGAGQPKELAYSIAEHRNSKKVTSLKELTDRELDDLYKYIMTAFRDEKP